MRLVVAALLAHGISAYATTRSIATVRPLETTLFEPYAGGDNIPANFVPGWSVPAAPAANVTAPGDAASDLINRRLATASKDFLDRLRNATEPARHRARATRRAGAWGHPPNRRRRRQSSKPFEAVNGSAPVLAGNGSSSSSCGIDPECYAKEIEDDIEEVADMADELTNISGILTNLGHCLETMPGSNDPLSGIIDLADAVAEGKLMSYLMNTYVNPMISASITGLEGALDKVMDGAARSAQLPVRTVHR